MPVAVSDKNNAPRTVARVEVFSRSFDMRLSFRGLCGSMAA
jgi:hypothetical protein